jgi:hypothetical protein
MCKKSLFFIVVLFTAAFFAIAIKPLNEENYNWFTKPAAAPYTLEFPTKNKTDFKQLKVPFTGRYFVAYKEAVAYRESKGNYNLVNSFGYMGKYQFGESALRAVGIYNKEDFLNNPQLQEKAFLALLSRNKWELREEIKKYSGKVVGDVYVTESGILAAAHLGGAGSVKRFFRSNGKMQIRDGYGTSIKSYLKKFGGYQTDFIKADLHAKVM